MDSLNDLQAIRQFLQDGEIFYIAGHVGPDGDAIGASFGLAMALANMGKKPRVLLEAYHSKYKIIPGKSLLYNMDEGFDPDEKFTLICVDCADAARLPECANPAWEAAEVTVCIDHHYTNSGFAMYNFIDGQASSTCEMVYRLLDEAGNGDTSNGAAGKATGSEAADCETEITPDIAAALYAGMVCDTGGFRYLATSPQTLQIAAALVAKNIPFNEIYTELVHLHTYTEVKLHARVMESCRRTPDGQIVYATVPRGMMKNLKDAPDARSGDLEGMVEYLLNIRRAKVSLLVYERDNGEIKVSLRSKSLDSGSLDSGSLDSGSLDSGSPDAKSPSSKSINVGSIAAQLGGGGHFQAAGATVRGADDVEVVAERVIGLIRSQL